MTAREEAGSFKDPATSGIEQKKKLSSLSVHGAQISDGESLKFDLAGVR